VDTFAVKKNTWYWFVMTAANPDEPFTASFLPDSKILPQGTFWFPEVIPKLNATALGVYVS